MNPTLGRRLAGAGAQVRVGRALREGDWWRYTLLTALSVLLLAPFAIAVLISLKSPSQFASNPYGFTWPLDFTSYATAAPQIIRSIVNSMIISGVTCLGVVSLGGLAGYAFARLDFPGKGVLYYLVLALLMIPGILTLVPTFVLVKQMGLLDSWLALILPWVAAGQVFAIFILRTFFESMPRELFEAARVDGAGEVRTFLRIAMPLSWEIVGVVAIFDILSTWNNFIWPLVTIRTQALDPLMLGLFQFQGEYVSAWGTLMAGYVLGTLPLIVLFMFASRLFVRGLAAGAVKL